MVEVVLTKGQKEQRPQGLQPEMVEFFEQPDKTRADCLQL